MNQLRPVCSRDLTFGIKVRSKLLIRIAAMYARWYSQSVRVDSFFKKLREEKMGFDVKFKNVGIWVGGVVGVVGLLFALLAFGIASGVNENNPNKKPVNPTGLITIAGMGFGLCLASGVTTWIIVSSGNRKLRKRMFAFADAIEKYDITSCGNQQLEEDYGIPLFHSVELPECPGKRLWAWLCGKWNKDEFAWVQGGQLIDPILGTLGDNALLNTGMRILGGRHASRDNRLRQAGFDAIVFSEELNLPDIVLGHRKVFETGYTRQEVQEYANPLPGIPATALGIWGGASDSNGAEGVYGALADIVNSRKCLIQVINGRAVIFLNSFLGWESDLVGSLQDVERELEFAHTIFRRLKFVSQVSDPNAQKPNDQIVDELFKSHGNFRPHWGKLIGGACLSLFGVLGLLGLANQTVLAPIEKPVIVAAKQIDAKVVKRGFTRGPDNPDGSKGSTARAWISYSYNQYGETFKMKEYLSEDYIDINAAKKMALDYSEGMQIKTWIDPSDPDTCALKESNIQVKPAPTRKKKLAGTELVSMSIFALAFLVMGLVLSVWGVIAGRHKVVIPEALQEGTSSRDLASRTTDAAKPETDSDDGSLAGLSSAKFYSQQPTGMLD